MDSIFYIYLFVLLPLMVGMMFVPMNGVYGIRCPWSMYSENTWRIVHKYGGYMGQYCLQLHLRLYLRD